MNEILQDKTFKLAMSGAIAGWATAASIDYAAFKAWKSAKEAMKYDWSLALWRWFKGFVIGGVGAIGSGHLLGM